MDAGSSSKNNPSPALADNACPYLAFFFLPKKAHARQEEKCGEAQERYSVRSRYGAVSWSSKK